MKLLLLFLLTIQSPNHIAELANLRLAFDKAVLSEKESKNFLATVNAKTSAIHRGYHAAVTMMMAKHVFSPYKKLALFNNGKAILDETILANPNEIELRFIRYMIQTNSPAFLNYNKELNSDKKLMEQQLPSLTDTDLKKRIEAYLTSKQKK